MDYKEKLRQFNSTEKYKSECDFVASLINMDYSIVLDYGCGIGTFMNEWHIDGYDRNDYYEGNNKANYYMQALPNREYSDITMIHSLAHFSNPIGCLSKLKLKYPNATITVITPNAYWLMLQSNNDYKPDPTVIKHYTASQLRELFEEAGYKVTLQGQFGEESNGVHERLFLQAR